MATPGQSSGAFDFGLSNAQVIFEAFDRVDIRGTAITRHHLISARNSLNLALQAWSNKGVNLWKVVSGQLTLVAGQAVYTLPTNLITLTEMWYTTVNGNGAGYNSDRIMVPITRTQYAMIPNKLQPGIPTQFWFERLQTPQVTLWEAPSQAAPNYTVNWFGLQRIQDAGIGSGETPDLVYRGLDALCAEMAYRLAVKFAAPLAQVRKADRDEAWGDLVSQDQEMGPVIFAPNVGVYGRM